MEALLILLPKKSEGQPRTYRHRKLTFTCPAGPCPAETSAASAQLKYTRRRIGTETRPIRNIKQLQKEGYVDEEAKILLHAGKKLAAELDLGHKCDYKQGAKVEWLVQKEYSASG
jgi:hypothetical protein